MTIALLIVGVLELVVALVILRAVVDLSTSMADFAATFKRALKEVSDDGR